MDEKELSPYQVEKILDDHENRIRRLEESDIRQQVQLAEIQKSQSEVKLLVMESNKEQSKTLSEFMKTMLDSMTSTIKENNKTKNKIKLLDKKETWVAISTLIGILSAVVTYLTKLK